MPIAAKRTRWGNNPSKPRRAVSPLDHRGNQTGRLQKQLSRMPSAAAGYIQPPFLRRRQSHHYPCAFRVCQIVTLGISLLCGKVHSSLLFPSTATPSTLQGLSKGVPLRSRQGGCDKTALTTETRRSQGDRGGTERGRHVCTARPGTTARPCLAGADGVQRPALSPSSSETARPVRALLRFSVNFSVAPVTLRFSRVRSHTVLNSFASNCTGVEPPARKPITGTETRAPLPSGAGA